MYKSFYKTPSCNIILVSDGKVLLGLYFENSNDTNKFNYECELKDNLPIFDTTRKWLDIYRSRFTDDCYRLLFADSKQKSYYSA